MSYFSFEDLPPELRNLVYKFALSKYYADARRVRAHTSDLFVFDTRSIARVNMPSGFPAYRLQLFGRSDVNTALTRASKAIRDESLGVLYDVNTFRFNLFDVEAFHGLIALLQWFDMLGPSALLLKHVEIYEQLLTPGHASVVRLIAIRTALYYLACKTRAISAKMLYALDYPCYGTLVNVCLSADLPDILEAQLMDELSRAANANYFQFPHEPPPPGEPDRTRRIIEEIMPWFRDGWKYVMG